METETQESKPKAPVKKTARKATKRRPKAQPTHPAEVTAALQSAKAPETALTFQMRNPNGKVTRRYELVGLERVDDETLAVKARPLYREGASPKGKPKTVGFLRLVQA